MEKDTTPIYRRRVCNARVPYIYILYILHALGPAWWCAAVYNINISLWEEKKCARVARVCTYMRVDVFNVQYRWCRSPLSATLSCSFCGSRAAPPD